MTKEILSYRIAVLMRDYDMDFESEFTEEEAISAILEGLRVNPSGVYFDLKDIEKNLREYVADLEHGNIDNTEEKEMLNLCLTCISEMEKGCK